ncbi:MAG: MMPL family transporter [Candidatus Omnitrophota bacterium]
MRGLIDFSIRRPKLVVALTLAAAILAAVQFFKVKIDTDPENMLPEKEFVRVFHKEMKKEFALYDYIVLGIVNEKNARGVFNPETLEKIYRVSEHAKSLDGVIGYELISPSTKDDIEQAGPATVSFKWLMKAPPYTAEEASRIGERSTENPLFYNTVVSQDGKALCVYIPIKSKDISYAVSKKIRSFISSLKGDEMYYMTGLPLAEDAFGTEMFVQMAISAPAAMLIIFLLLLLFFRKIQLVIAPMILAGVVVIMTMGLLVGLGFPIHIMSSMIPIFLMPIAVLDSVHILSEFFEKLKKHADKAKTIKAVMNGLFSAMLFTSLTTIAGFFSLSFAPIPPIQVFGVFVAIGVALAWILTMTFIPAFIVLLDESKFKGYGATEKHTEGGFTNNILAVFGNISVKHWKAVFAGTIIMVGISIWGILHIQINDNPVKWFAAKHPIRLADTVLNRHFGGTYTAYLILEAQDKGGEVFKEPSMLGYIERLQEYLHKKGDVGKSTSLADVTKKVYYELLGGDKAQSKIPSSKEAVAQCLISYENSHKPDDLWHFVTPDYSKLNLWLQLRSGDNRDMTRVTRHVEEFFRANPPPYPLSHNWTGLTYINMIWQDRMVVGMLFNFIGSFIIVLFMMIILFKSPVKGAISMIPMTVTVLFIYASLGFIGKDYDMPVAVLSALTLGLSIDFAIHFLQHAIELYEKRPDWPAVAKEMSGGPGRALVRNALVIAIGFLPLLLSPLVPYQTVGVFMFLIMLASSVATLIILPAFISAFPALMLEKSDKFGVCSCKQCMLVAAVIAGTIAYCLIAYMNMKWGPTTLISVAVMIAISFVCYMVSRSKVCAQKE